MKTAVFKLAVGALFMLGHFTGIILIVIQFRRFDSVADTATHALILGSFTTFLAVAFFRYLFQLLPGTDTDLTTSVNAVGAYPILAICLLASIALIAMVSYLAFRTDFDAGSLRTALTAYETLLGVFLGFAGETLFGAKRDKPVTP